MITFTRLKEPVIPVFSVLCPTSLGGWHASCVCASSTLTQASPLIWFRRLRTLQEARHCRTQGPGKPLGLRMKFSLRMPGTACNRGARSASAGQPKVALFSVPISPFSFERAVSPDSEGDLLLAEDGASALGRTLSEPATF